MIAFLRGKLLEKHPNQVIVETGGVGYDVLIPISTFSALPDAGAEVQPADLHSRSGRCARAVRLSDRRGKNDLREADLGERHRSLARNQSAFRTWRRPI